MIRKAISVLALIATVLGLYNVYGDNTAAVHDAETLACGDKGCVRLIRASRTALGQSFSFQTSVQPQKTVDVECKRSLLFVGNYRCTQAQ